KARFGRVDEYKESKEDFESYIEHFEVASVTLTKMSAMSYNDLKAALIAHYIPQPFVIAKHFKFQKRNQKEVESVADYIVALRQLSVSCEFGQYLSEAFRDRFVIRLYSESMQCKLLSQKDLMFNQAHKIASSMELCTQPQMERK
uniref:Tick transposon n=1 Tax=Cyprinus carpio TaxID=7962 RepID=A0A8C2KIA9_CYPCA